MLCHFNGQPAKLQTIAIWVIDGGTHVHHKIDYAVLHDVYRASKKEMEVKLEDICKWHFFDIMISR